MNIIISNFNFIKLNLSTPFVSAFFIFAPQDIVPNNTL